MKNYVGPVLLSVVFSVFISGSMIYSYQQYTENKLKTEKSEILKNNNPVDISKIDFSVERFNSFDKRLNEVEVKLSDLISRIEHSSSVNNAEKLTTLQNEIVRLRVLLENIGNTQLGLNDKQIELKHNEMDLFVRKNAEWIANIVNVENLKQKEKTIPLNEKMVRDTALQVGKQKSVYFYKINCGNCYDNYQHINDDTILFPVENDEIGPVLYWFDTYYKAHNAREIRNVVFTNRIEKREDLYKIYEKYGININAIKESFNKKEFMTIYFDNRNAMLNSGFIEPVLYHNNNILVGPRTNKEINDFMK